MTTPDGSILEKHHCQNQSKL